MGDEHDDAMYGNSGFDLIFGQAGADTLDSRDNKAGNDVNIGGLDSDVCLKDNGDSAYECSP